MGCGEADDPASGVDREVVGRNAFVLDFWIVGNLGVKPDDVPKLAKGNAEPGTRFAAAPWTTSEGIDGARRTATQPDYDVRCSPRLCNRVQRSTIDSRGELFTVQGAPGGQI